MRPAHEIQPAEARFPSPRASSRPPGAALTGPSAATALVACTLAASTLVACALVACQGAPPSPPTSSRAEIDAAIHRGISFLLQRQGADGAWRSDVYGAFKSGDALTPLVLRALLAAPATDPADRAIRRGQDFLAAIAPGSAAKPPLFAVYTSALATEALASSEDPSHRAALAAWRTELEARQLNADLGWERKDAPFGGWGYSSAMPRKPEPGNLAPPLVESNTSATIFALRGLHAAGLDETGEICRNALIFLDSMQNFAETAGPFDDGGFFFIYDDPVRNKGGVAGIDGEGTQRFHSYGSTTADGLRGSLLCGRDPGHPRVQAALTWLLQNFSGSEHPGRFTPRLEADRNGLYFYWAAAVSEALGAAGVGAELRTSAGDRIPWAGRLAHVLLERQNPDGSWANAIATMREDEPVIATAMALSALTELRRAPASNQSLPHISP